MNRPYGVRNPKRENGVMQFTGLPATALTAAQSMVIPANFGVYVPGRYEIPAAMTVEIAATAIFEIG